MLAHQYPETRPCSEVPPCRRIPVAQPHLRHDGEPGMRPESGTDASYRDILLALTRSKVRLRARLRRPTRPDEDRQDSWGGAFKPAIQAIAAPGGRVAVTPHMPNGVRLPRSGYIGWPAR